MGETATIDQTGWNTYGMEWTEDGIQFYVNGEKIGSVLTSDNANWPYNDENNEFYLIIDQQIGGSWVEGADSKGIDQTTLASSGAAFSIDYVRVYSTSEYAHIIPEPSAFGLLAGIGALALAISRRRRK